MLELKNNKHNTYYRCTYLYIVNAVILKLLMTILSKMWFIPKKNNNVTTLICLAISSFKFQVLFVTYTTIQRLYNQQWNESDISACKGSAQSSCSIFSRSELIWQYWRTCCFGKGRGSTETSSKLFANHNALGQLTNHNIYFFGRRAFIKPGTNWAVCARLGRKVLQ